MYKPIQNRSDKKTNFSQISLASACIVEFFEKSLYYLIGCYDCYLYFLDEKSGQLIWKFGTGNIIKSSPVLIDKGNKCLFGSHDKCLYLLDIEVNY